MMEERAIRIECEGERLLGILHPPRLTAARSAAELAVLILVGGPQYRVGSHRQFLLLARHLASLGYPVLRFDFRGMGDSTGLSPGFNHVDVDIKAALDALFRETPGLKSACVLGLCDGASAALLHCSSDSRVAALVLANPWVRTEASQAAAVIKHYYGDRLLQKSFWTKVLGGRFNPLSAAVEFVASLRASHQSSITPVPFIERMLEGLKRFRGPVLLLSSGRDLTAREFDDLCRSNPGWAGAIHEARVRRVDLSEADHTFSTRESLDEANSHIAGFISQVSSACSHKS